MSGDVPEFGGTPNIQQLLFAPDYVSVRLRLYCLFKKLHPTEPSNVLENMILDAEEFVLAADKEDPEADNDIQFKPEW